MRVNSCIVCGECVLAAEQEGGSLLQAASETRDWSAFSGPGSNLLANICAAEIHPFIFLFLFSPSSHLESFPLVLYAALTWTKFHGCSFFGTISCTVLCGLICNDGVGGWGGWGGQGEQVYLFFPVRFTFFLSSLLSVCSFILGSVLYFSYYLRDNCCNTYIASRPAGGGGEINT